MGGGCVLPKMGGGGETLASVELCGGVGAVQVSGNLGLAVIPRFDTKKAGSADPYLWITDPDPGPFFAYYRLS